MSKTPHENATILIIDDNEANRYAVARILRNGGFEVAEAATGEEGVRRAAENPDLIILDVNLPDMNGLEVCKRIKTNPDTASLVVIHLSAHFVSSSDKAYGLEQGADGYLTHPIDPAVLLGTVNAYVRLRRAVSNLELERELRDRFVSTLTHDLRNPLTAAKMSAQVLLRNPIDLARRHNLINRILGSLERADRMIQDLLDANRVRAGQEIGLDIVRCNLAAISTDVLEDLITTHGDRFIFKSDPKVEGYWSPDGLRRVIENLVNNAIKYGDHHTPVCLTLSKADGNILLSVHNAGEPIPEADQPSLFQPYLRTQSAQTSGKKGWGLGLTLVLGIVEAHGGTVSVVSAAGKGTTFTIKLPLDARKTSQKQQTA